MSVVRSTLRNAPNVARQSLELALCEKVNCSAVKNVLRLTKNLNNIVAYPMAHFKYLEL